MIELLPLFKKKELVRVSQAQPTVATARLGEALSATVVSGDPPHKKQIWS
jgi:hypothetical protein